MAKRWFQVSGEVTVSCFTYVFADSAEAAMEQANGRQCFIQKGWSEDGSEERFMVEDADGEGSPVRAFPVESAQRIRELNDFLEGED